MSNDSSSLRQVWRALRWRDRLFLLAFTGIVATVVFALWCVFIWLVLITLQWVGAI